MKISYLSASRLNTYIACPFKYFLQYHLKLPELNKSGISALKGSAVHEALEKHVGGEDYESVLKNFYADNKVWEADDRKAGYIHPVEKSCNGCKWAVSAGKETICSIAKRDIKSFDGCPRPNFEEDLKLVKYAIYREDSPLSKKIVGAEVPFDFEIEGFKAVGFIDLIIEIDEETVEVIDYKTGRSKNEDEAKVDLQMRIYSLIVKSIFPQYKYAIMTLDYLKYSPVSVAFGPKQDADTREFLIRAYKKILEDTNPSRNKSWLCRFCVGYEECGKIRNNYVDDGGKFVMPPPVTAEEKAIEENE